MTMTYPGNTGTGTYQPPPSTGLPTSGGTDFGLTGVDNTGKLSTGTPTTSTPADVSGTTGATGSAKAILTAALGQLGLQGLADWAWSKYQAGESFDQIYLEMRQTPEYKARFPYMEALAAKGRAITEAQAINYEQTAAGLMRQYGLPPGFYDQPSDFANLIGGEVSVAELSQRLSTYENLAFNTDPNIKAELQRLYGLSSGDILAYTIDPAQALPIIQRKAQAAQTAATSFESGYGDLSQTEAERWSNLNANQAQQGFGTLATLSEVTSQLPGEATAGMSREDAQAALLGGNALLAQQIADRQAARRAVFTGGGGYSAAGKGFTGIGGG